MSLPTDEAVIDRQFDQLDALVGRLRMPFYYVAGNHDISNPVMHRKYLQRRGRDYCHFVHRGILFLVLNTEDPPASHISEFPLTPPHPIGYHGCPKALT